MSAEALVQLVRTLDVGPGYDVVATLKPDIPAADLAKAGATWAMDGPAGPEEPILELRSRILAGPPTLS
jgi:hypothetical protein